MLRSIARSPNRCFWAARRAAVVIVNGTLAAAVGLGLRLWLAGAAIWLVGHLAAVWATRRDPAFIDVVRRHLRYPQHLST